MWFCIENNHFNRKYRKRPALSTIYNGIFRNSKKKLENRRRNCPALARAGRLGAGAVLQGGGCLQGVVLGTVWGERVDSGQWTVGNELLGSFTFVQSIGPFRPETAKQFLGAFLQILRFICQFLYLKIYVWLLCKIQIFNSKNIQGNTLMFKNTLFN